MAAELTNVVQAVAPTLRGWGYRRFGQTFNREREGGLIHVIGFQSSRSGDRFTVNVGIYVREIDQLWHDYWTREGPGLGTTKVLREESCWLRGRVGWRVVSSFPVASIWGSISTSQVMILLERETPAS